MVIICKMIPDQKKREFAYKKERKVCEKEKGKGKKERK